MVKYRMLLLSIPSMILISNIEAASDSRSHSSSGSRQRQFQQNAVVAAHEPAIGRKQSSWSGIFTVPQGTVAVREKFGRHVADYGPGTYACSPFGITKFTLVSTKNRDVDVTFTATTRDLQRLQVSVAYCYQITRPSYSVYHVENLENAMTDMLSRSILSNFGRMTYQDTIGLDRDELSHSILVAMNTYVHSAYEHRPSDMPDHDEGGASSSGGSIVLEHMPTVTRAEQSRDWGVNINRLAITNIEYPQAIMEAMNNQRAAEMQRSTLIVQTEAARERTRIEAEASQQKTEVDATAARRKAELDAEGKALQLKINTDMQLQTAEAEAGAKVRKAQGDAEALRVATEAHAMKVKMEAEAQAEKIKQEAAAEAQAMALRGRALQDNPALFELEKFKYAADAVARIAASPNAKVLMMDPNSPNNLFSQMLALQSVAATAALPVPGAS